MVDNAFEPTEITAKPGETIRFVFDNSGKVTHDAFIGDGDAQDKHADEMADASGMHHGGGEGILVDAGKRGELIHTFDKAGSFEIGCHQPGHYEAGMKVVVTVT